MQNIAEGSQASGTSKKTELKLTNVARASLEELRLDYEDFLRQHNLTKWEPEAPEAWPIAGGAATADEVAVWVREEHDRGLGGRSGLSGPEQRPPTYPELAANAALVLLAVACSLLDRQLAAQATAFENEGGFTERLYRVRSQKRSFKPCVHAVHQVHPVHQGLKEHPCSTPTPAAASTPPATFSWAKCPTPRARSSRSPSR